MSVMIQGDQIRALLLGVRVTKPATTLVQNTATDLFNVTGGLVAVTSLVGVVTTAVANTASLTAKLQFTPTGGAAADLAAATGITNDPVGTFYSWTFADGDELISQLTPGGTEAPNVTYAPILDTPALLPAGSLEVVVSDHDPGTGAVKWYLTYIPYDNGAAVEAA